MKILFVSHDAGLTGAPRIAFDLAREFSNRGHVTVAVKRKGQLLDFPEFKGIFEDVIVTNSHHEESRLSYGDKVAQGTKIIKGTAPDLVYVNSCASSEWAEAAEIAGVPAVLHVHEQLGEIVELVRGGACRLDSLNEIDLLVGASEGCIKDLHSVGGATNAPTHLFGVTINVPRIRALATEAPGMALRWDGSPLNWRRPVVAMCGVASLRKGADLFYECSRKVGSADFLWIGPWNDDLSSAHNPVSDRPKKDMSDNFYFTNVTKNPYAYMAKSSLFALTSREDPNPLVVPEAIALDRAVLSFERSGGACYWTNQFGYTLSGRADVDRLCSFIRRYLEQVQEIDRRFEAGEGFLMDVDLPRKAQELFRKLEELSGSAVYDA